MWILSILWFGWKNTCFMQPSMGTLHSPTSRVVKDSTPSRRRILSCINFGIGESSPNLYISEHGELLSGKIWSTVNLERTGVLLLYYFLYLKVNLDLEKTNQLGESSVNIVFAVVNLDPIVIKKKRKRKKKKTWSDGESWPNDFVVKVNRGEELMRWVDSRCPLTHELAL